MPQSFDDWLTTDPADREPCVHGRDWHCFECQWERLEQREEAQRNEQAM